MINNLYAIHDKKLNSFDTPFSSENDATAKRLFTRFIERVPLMAEHPEDFTVHFLGHQNADSGILTPITPVQYVCSGLDCKKPQQQATTNEKTKVSDDSSIQPST